MIFEELATIYFEIDNNYSVNEAAARAKRYNRIEASYRRKRELNDQAYFLFMFTRLEDRIRELSTELIENKYNNIANWHYRRTWEILYKRKKDIPLLDRVALLTKIGQIDFNLIKHYYDQRNNIGHGGAFTITIDIITVVADMQRLYYALE